MDKVLAYLQGALLDQYLELLPSRWSALLPRLAKRTQRLHALTDLTTVNELESAVEDGFQLATTLLHAEHGIYQEGVALFDGLSQASDLVQHTWRLLANDVLAELAAKELMLAHWKAAVATITADTLRVYSHALLVHARVTTARVHHLMALLREEEAEMPKHSRRELSPPLPKAGMIGAAVECLHAVLHEVTLQQQALQAAITMQVRDSCAAGSTRMYTFLETSRHYLRYVLVFYVLLMAALVVLVANLSGCLVTSVATAAGIRHLVLANVPGTAVIPLHFNALPFHDDDWMRHLPEDTALRDFILPDRETHELIQSRTQRVDSLSLLHQHMGQFADAKFSLLNHFVNSHLASTTMHIPRTAASPQVFSPRGGVNLESLFQLGPAMFNAKGEYTAKLQVVLAKEEVGRVVSLILESAMLFSEDAMAVQSVAQLDVLFTKSTSVTVRTGPLHRSWLVLLLGKVLRFWFCLPVWSYEYLVSALRQQDSAPFPPIDSSREVAVVLEVYHRFTPPLDLQPRLRAMNFTLYQLPDAGAPSRVKVSRLIFFSTVQLTGVARWLTDYPVSTFLLLVAILFAAFAVASVGSLLGLLAYAYWRWFREQPPELFDEADSDDEFFAPPRAIPTTVVKNMAPPRLRRHLSSNELYDTLDTSQLRRSQSFNYSPAKKKE